MATATSSEDPVSYVPPIQRAVATDETSSSSSAGSVPLAGSTVPVNAANVAASDGAVVTQCAAVRSTCGETTSAVHSQPPPPASCAKKTTTPGSASSTVPPMIARSLDPIGAGAEQAASVRAASRKPGRIEKERNGKID